MERKLLGSPMADGWSCGSTVAISETTLGSWYESVHGGVARCYNRVEKAPGAWQLAWGTYLGTVPQEGLKQDVRGLGQHFQLETKEQMEESDLEKKTTWEDFNNCVSFFETP